MNTMYNYDVGWVSSKKNAFQCVHRFVHKIFYILESIMPIF